MAVDVRRTIASVACSILGSETVSTRTSPVPCRATAFVSGPPGRRARRSLSVSPGAPRHLESAELTAAQRCAPANPVAGWLEQIDETAKRSFVMKGRSSYHERESDKRPDTRLAAAAGDSLAHAVHRWQQTAGATHCPYSVEIQRAPLG
jgi:hypothetical protein